MRKAQQIQSTDREIVIFVNYIADMLVLREEDRENKQRRGGDGKMG